MRDYQRDEDGVPQLVESFVLFLDLLGTSAMATAADAQQHLSALDKALAKARPFARDDDDARFVPSEPWFVSAWFSDNLALAAPIRTSDGEPELGIFLNAVAGVQLHLALDGFFSRGGLAVGQQFMDPQITFGPALVEAVELENTAVYPRVLLGRSVVNLVKTHLRYYGDPLYAPHNSALFVGPGGEVFVNYLDHLRNYVAEDLRDVSDWIAQHRDRILEQLARHNESPRIWEKYAWLAAYHNAFCSHHGLKELTISNDAARVNFYGVGSATAEQSKGS